MEDKPEQSRQPDLCEECKINPSKYKCPGCALRSCSLPCVNSHKKRTNCTGKRPATDFVHISKFDDNLLLSDYHMLEDVKRIADSARRTRVKLCGSQTKLARHLKSLRSAASSRRTKIIFVPNGMSRRDTNRTYYKNAEKSIFWTIEWRFYSTDVVLVDHGVNENTTLSSVIENHLKPGPWNHPLKQFCDQNLDSLKFLIRKNFKGSKALFRQLNIKAPIREQLADIGILEYPVIHVFLPSDTYNFEVINETTPNKDNIKNPSPKGVTFKVEEIRDGEFGESRVIDLMKEESDKDSEKIPLVESISNCDILAMKAEENNLRTKSCIEQLVAIGDMDFDLGTGLMDVYTDKFFDLEGILEAQMDLDDEEFVEDEEELEEGEID